MKIAGTSILLFASSALTAAPADTQAHAQALLEAAKKASGGTAWDSLAFLHQTLSIETAGLKGKAEAWTEVRAGHFSNSFELGPESGAEGWDGQTHWTADHSGQVRPETGGDAIVSAKTQAYQESLSYWYPERAKGAVSYVGAKTDRGEGFDVVRVEPVGGRPVELWISAASHRIERTVEKKELDTVTVTFSDWRAVSGRMVPFASRSSIGNPKYDQVTKIVSLDSPASIPASRFSPPAPPPEDFAFSSGVDRTTVPFQLNNNHIYLSAKLNGKPVTLVFDTGATNYLYKESLNKVGAKAEGALPGGGVGTEKEDTALARVSSIELGSLTIRDQVFAVASSGGWPGIEGVPSDGLLGYEVAKRVPIRIDYQRGELTLFKPGAFREPTQTKPISFRFAEHLPEIDGAIDGLPARMHLDTGSRSSIDLTGPYIGKNKLLEKYAPKWEAVTGWGVGGAARSRLARARGLSLGNQTLKDVVVELTAQTQGAFSSEYYDGNVGGEILRRFTLTLDYANRRLWLEPNAQFGDPFVFDRSGMFLALDGDSFLIKDVTAQGPASKAGLKSGDRISRINGNTPASMSLPRLRQWLKSAPPGTQVEVQRSTGAAVTVVLADLV